MPPEEHEIQALRTDVAGLRATVIGQSDHIARIDSWLQRISDDLRKKPERNNAPVYVGLITAVSVLFTLGAFALRPVQEEVARNASQVELLRTHDGDGHPEAVVQSLHKLEEVHTRAIELNRKSLARDEDRVDSIEVRLATLETIAEERTERFKRTLEQRDKLSEIRAGDRHTGSEQRVYAAGVAQRQDALEARMNTIEADILVNQRALNGRSQ